MNTPGTRSTWTFATAGELVFGPGAVTELGGHVAHRGWVRVLIVTDPNLVSAGVTEPVLSSLREANIEAVLFDGGEPEPAIETACIAAAFARETQPDAIIGLGGGSNLDLAKIVANLHRHGGEPEDYFGFDLVPGPITPVIGIPTTAGTGSEVSHSAVLTDVANEMKVSTLSHHFRPTLAVVDPKLSLTCPVTATADAGIDALVHAIEAYTAVDYTQLDIPSGTRWPYAGRHPIGDVLAEKAISLVGEHLRTAVREPENLTAREGMALASTLAGMAFSNCGVAVVHALEYPLGGAVHVSHGRGNGLLLPYVLRFNLPTRTERIANLGRLLGVVDENSGSVEETADATITGIERLREAIGIPHRISELGANREDLQEFARKAFAVTRLMSLNPRRPTEADLLSILENAF